MALAYLGGAAGFWYSVASGAGRLRAVSNFLHTTFMAGLVQWFLQTEEVSDNVCLRFMAVLFFSRLRRSRLLPGPTELESVRKHWKNVAIINR